MSFWYRSDGCSNKTHSRRQNSTTGRARRWVGAFTVMGSLGVVAQAQESLPPGMVATLDVTQRLEYSDNPDLEADGTSDFFGRTILAFGLDSATPLSRFSLDAGTDIEEGRNDRSSVDLTNSFVQLGYGRAVRSASFDASLNYRESDVSSSFLSDDFDLDGNILEQDSGTRQSFGLQLGGVLGIDAPIGASFDLSYRGLRYNDTDDPDLNDQDTLDLSAAVLFRLDPRITAELTAKYIDFDTQGDGTDRETTGFGTGLLVDITPVLRGDFAVSYDRIERSGNETGTSEGLSVSAGLTRELTNGTLGATLSSDVSSNDDGRRSFFTVDRAMDLSRRARLSYSLGGTRSENSAFEPLINIDYAYALPTSEVSFGLSQRVNTDSDNREQVSTTLNAGYQHQINSLSSLSADLSIFDRNELGVNANDAQRIDISLSYRYAVTRDWGIVSGYTHRRSLSDTAEDRVSNTVFLGLQRNFSWSP